MKKLNLSPVAFIFCCSMAYAQSSFTNELDRLTKQRDKAVAEATAPINRKFEELSGRLLKKATQAGDLDAALKIKAAMQLASEQQKQAPEVQTFEMQILGRWECKSSSGWRGVYTFKEDGTWEASQNGVNIGTGKWKRVGNSFRVVQGNGKFDGYELPIVDRKLVGKSVAGNTLNLTRMPSE